MGKLTFKGGVHPFDGKEFSKDKPIKELLPEGDMVFPLSQHIGAPAVPVVAKVTMSLRDSLLLRPPVSFQPTFTHLYPVPLRL